MLGYYKIITRAFELYCSSSGVTFTRNKIIKESKYDLSFSI